MRRFLLASAAAASLALAFPVQAQTPEPVPATPPITMPEPEADVTVDERIGVTGQAAPTEGATAPDPAAPASAPMQSPAQASGASSNAGAICAPRTTAVNLGARGATLNRDNSNTLERAVDAASVCNLQQVVIADAAEGALSARRARTVQALLVRQGVPADLITVQHGAAAEPGQIEVRMTFSGVARADAPTAASTSLEPGSPSAPDAAPDAVPAEPDVDVETDDETPADT